MAWNVFIVIEDEDTGEKRWLPIDSGLEFLDAVETAEELAPQAGATPYEWLEPEKITESEKRLLDGNR